MSDQMRLLLDKGVIRRYFEGVSTLARDRELTEEQQQAIILVHVAPRLGGRLFISQEASNLLRAHSHELAPGESLMFLRRVEILYPARYFKRWARRLRQRTLGAVRSGPASESAVAEWHRRVRNPRLKSWACESKPEPDQTERI